MQEIKLNDVMAGYSCDYLKTSVKTIVCRHSKKFLQSCKTNILGVTIGSSCNTLPALSLITDNNLVKHRHNNLIIKCTSKVL